MTETASLAACWTYPVWFAYTRYVKVPTSFMSHICMLLTAGCGSFLAVSIAGKVLALPVNHARLTLEPQVSTVTRALGFNHSRELDAVQRITFRLAETSRAIEIRILISKRFAPFGFSI